MQAQISAPQPSILITSTGGAPATSRICMILTGCPSFWVTRSHRANPPGAKDLQRNTAGRAMIGDPRNDENAIVSQLQGLVLRFHNRMVEQHPGTAFNDIQMLVRHHYQYIVLNDFLPRIVNSAVLDELKTHGAFDRSKLKLFTSF